MTLFAITTTFLAASPTGGALEFAASRFWWDAGIEAAGVFWIAAEVGILFAVSVGRRVLAERPLPERFALTRGERRMCVVLVLGVALLAAGVFGRHLVVSPLPEAIATLGTEAPVNVAASVRSATVEHVRTHLAIWCAFIAAWVALEIAIVAQGIRAFRALARLTGQSPGRGLPATAVSGLTLFALTLFATGANAQDITPQVAGALLRGFEQGMADASVAYRFVELYLRVAGAVWIAVEWIAAIYLLRGVAMLRRFFKGGQHVS